MDYHKLSHDELINKCKEFNIDYLTKTNKPKAIKTLISLLLKSNQPKTTYEENYSSLDTIIDKCHNFLYTKGITGSKAQNDIMKIFTVVIINYLNNNGNEYIINLIENYKKTNGALKIFYEKFEGDLSKVEENKLSVIKNHLYYLDYLKKFSLILVPDNRNNRGDENDMWKSFVQECLSKIFPDIYSNEDYIINCKYKFALSNLIEIISKFNINDLIINELQSINGDIHEKFLKYEGNKNSKELGQFFTPREIIKTILNNCGFKDLIENLEGNDLSIYDPCLGTGGLLCYTYNSCKSKINSENIYGCEIESDTMKLGIVSLMISTNNCNKNIKRCNSLIENPYLFEDKKFDIIFTNPPFGTKTNYKQLEKDFEDFKKNKYPTSSLNFKDIYKISGNTGINLFIQNIIYLLNIGGIACIILPDGELMIGKSSINIRKYILDNCRILKIITINSGAFTNTTIKTKALIIQKGNYDNYNKEIEYFDINSNGVDNLGFEKLNENLQFNLNIVEEEKEYGEDIEIKTLGEICEINYGTRITKKNNIEGDYDVYGGGDKTFKTNNYNREGFNIIIGRFAISKKCVRLLNKKLYLNDSGLSIKPLNNCNLFHKYIGYYLYNNQFKIYELARGTAQQNLDINEFNNLKIPIPPLNKQEITVDFMDSLYEIIDDNKKKIDKINKINDLYLKINLIKYEIKTIGEVCEIKNGKRIVKKNVENGEYPVLGGGGFTSFYTNEYSREGKTCKISREGMSLHNCVMILNQKYYLNSQAFTIKSNNCNIIINEYLWYFLDNNKKKIFKCGRGTAQKAIDIDEFNNLKIPIPSLEKQKEIVEYLDNNTEIIKNLEKEIEYNKKITEDLFKQIL
jgi:type I restriction enzyme S subunit